MSEEEKKAVEHLNSFLNIPEFVWIKENELLMINVKIALNLIEKQQKELNNLKEIEKTHKEENGKLRVELEQEKEKNKDLEEKLKIAVAMLTKGTYPEENEGDNDFDKQFIAVDKIKGIQCRLFVQLGSYVQNEASPEQERIAGGINIINEILEEK